MRPATHTAHVCCLNAAPVRCLKQLLPAVSRQHISMVTRHYVSAVARQHISAATTEHMPGLPFQARVESPPVFGQNESHGTVKHHQARPDQEDLIQHTHLPTPSAWCEMQVWIFYGTLELSFGVIWPPYLISHQSVGVIRRVRYLPPPLPHPRGPKSVFSLLPYPSPAPLLRTAADPRRHRKDTLICRACIISQPGRPKRSIVANFAPNMNSEWKPKWTQSDNGRPSRNMRRHHQIVHLLPFREPNFVFFFESYNKSQKLKNC